MNHDQTTAGAATDRARDDVVCRAFGLQSLNEAARTVECVASTDALDSYGDIVEQTWRLERFRANPVVLYNHQRYGELPIGTAENVRLENGALCATLKIATAEANPRAEQVWQSIRQGTLRTVSVGFVPNEIRAEMRDGRDVYVLADNELHEISVVPIPANPEAVLRMRARASIGSPRGTAAAPTNPEVSTMKFLALAAKLGIAAPTEEAAEAAILLLAEEGAQTRAALGTKSAAETGARVVELKADAAELLAARAELAAAEKIEAKRAEVERSAHVDAVIEARPSLADARDALESFAKADYDRFAKKYPRPANSARERALTSQVVPAGGATPEEIAARAADPVGGMEATIEAGDALARELMAKDPSLEYAKAFSQAGKAIGAARRMART